MAAQADQYTTHHQIPYHPRSQSHKYNIEDLSALYSGDTLLWNSTLAFGILSLAIWIEVNPVSPSQPSECVIPPVSTALHYFQVFWLFWTS